ncbi:hypothetical protein COLU111180_18850 [Cohnella lubricantis]|nr:hypothetical protein [Cohnella lubricantis]MBP2120007.1 hypothetical protein [Cohnella lubricantis]
MAMSRTGCLPNWKDCPNGAENTCHDIAVFHEGRLIQRGSHDV